MLDKEIIQYRGFRNLTENGQVVGFQFKVRTTYYRGIYLSQLRPGTVIVDGERFEKEDVIWCVGGHDYRYEEMKYQGRIHWQVLEPAIIKIRKPGGLSQGYHDVTIGFTYSSSYLPPERPNLDPDADGQRFAPEMGPHVNHRRLLMV